MKTKYFEVLSPEEVKIIDKESKRILEECGVKVLHNDCLDLLEYIGCDVDKKSSIVRMPSEIVQRAIDSLPEKYFLYGRDPSYKIEVGGKDVNFGPTGYAVFAEDFETGKRRRALRKDLIDHLKVSDALEGITLNHVNVMPSDIPNDTGDLYIWADALIYQTKPIMSMNYNPRSIDILMDMGAILRGSKKKLIDKPLFCLDITTLPPLTQDPHQVDRIILGTKYGIPLSIGSGPICGISCPVTLASCISQSNAEVLSGIVISYAVKPGAKIIYSSWGRHLDMRFGIVTMGGPEFALLKICTAQMARFYKIPSRGGGVLTDSLMSDVQAGYEKMLTTLIPAMAGLNCICGMGLNESENLQSLPQLIIDNEIVLMVKRILKGIEIDKEHLATDLVISIGPKGNFLGTDHTNKFFKSELFIPEISNRMVYENWFDKDSKSIKALAIEKAKKLLSNSPEDLIEPDVIKEIYNLVKKA